MEDRKTSGQKKTTIMNEKMKQSLLQKKPAKIAWHGHGKLLN